MLETAGIQYGSATSQTLPRVTSGKTKAPPPPPPPRGSSALTKKPGDLNDSGELKKEKFLQGLLNTAPVFPLFLKCLLSIQDSFDGGMRMR